jgi:hypothetical protein
MSGLYENLPFRRGATYGTIGGGTQFLGKEYIHEDFTYGTGMLVKVRVCINSSGIALVPKRSVAFNLTAGKGEYDVAGYADVAAARTAIIDEFLPASGVPIGDLFYVVVGGPCLARTGMAGDVTNSFAVGDWLYALTAATTGATTSGRVGADPLTGATSVLALNILGIVGQAMSAKTTANTNADVLINAMGVGHF